VDAPNEAVVEMKFNETRVDLGTIFDAQYEHIARVITGVTKDPARKDALQFAIYLKPRILPEAIRQARMPVQSLTSVPCPAHVICDGNGLKMPELAPRFETGISHRRSARR
jgi:hypothetical protein